MSDYTLLSLAMVAAMSPISALGQQPSIRPAFEETPRAGVFMVHQLGRALEFRPEGVRAEHWGLRFLGANPRAKTHAQDRTPGRVNYFRGSDPSRWRRDLATWNRIQYQGIYPGIDVAYYEHEQNLEYDLIVAPGADPRRIRIGFPGLDSDGVKDGSLQFKSAGASVLQRKPIAYQTIQGRRVSVAVEYRLHAGVVTLEVAPYDRAKPLIIDPMLVYSTYLGGIYSQSASVVTSDREGNIVVAGVTQSGDFPTTASAYLTSFNIPEEVFVTKFKSDGTLIYSTFLGVAYSGPDAIATDIYDSVYLTGEVGSSPPLPNSVPLTPGALSNGDEYVVKLNAAGNALLYGARFPGRAQGAAVDQAGNLYITGQSNTIPVTKGAFQEHSTGRPGYVAKLDAAANRILYATYLGGSGADYPTAIAVDAAGDAYVTGYTYSTDFPTLNAFQSHLNYQGFFGTTNGQTWSAGTTPLNSTLTSLALDPTTLVSGKVLFNCR
jgi:hypothetical protein